MVPPGTWYFTGPPYPGEAMDVRTGVLLEFTDAAGLRWKLTARGVLARVKGDWLEQQTKENKPLNRALTRLIPK
jgi:hypothetical protein